MSEGESRKHHFVPEFMLKPWLVDHDGERLLHGYYWNLRQNQLCCRRKGLNAFCYGLYLLSLRFHRAGRDVLERRFFGSIDSKGAEARDLLISDGPAAMNSDLRSDFGRLLLSLDARRPENVAKLRARTTDIKKALDGDREIQVLISKMGIDASPSEYAETILSLEDRALGVLEPLVDNETVGLRFINSHWGLKRLAISEGTFVLSDRPLIRWHAFDSPAAVWLIPLSSKVAFFAANDIARYKVFRNMPPRRFAKVLNTASILNADRYVFSTSERHIPLLAQRLRPQQPSP